FGELGVFSPGRARTASAVAVTDCELLLIAERDIVAAFYQNPAFALSLMRLIVRRQSENIRAIEEKLLETEASAQRASPAPRAIQGEYRTDSIRRRSAR